MKQLFKRLFYNEIVQRPTISQPTSILVIGSNIPMGL